MLIKIRKSRWAKAVIFLMILFMFSPLEFIPVALALSGGPTPPEYSAFQKVSPGNLVDPFTGNVQYSLPLFDIGGYPINLTYSGDINPEQNAGWVGLGWSLQAGSIGRAMRGVPDDFRGDDIEKEVNVKPRIIQSYNFQYANKEGKQVELAGLNGGISMDGLPTIIHDNYRGFGINYDLNIEFGIFNGLDSLISDSLAPRTLTDSLLPDSVFKVIRIKKNIIPILDFNTNYSSFEGNSYEVIPRFGFIENNTLGIKGKKFNILFGSPSIRASTSTGITSIGMGGTMAYKGGSGSISLVKNFTADFTTPAFIPFFNPDMRASVRTFGLTLAGDKIFADKRAISVGVTISTEKMNENSITKRGFGCLYMADGEEHSDALLDHKSAPIVLDDYTQRLSPTVATHDVFNISASGVGGSFKVKHNSLGVISPPEHKVTSVTNPKVVLQLGGQTNWEIAGDIGLRHVLKKIERWEGKNEAAEFLDFKPSELNNVYESHTMRNNFEFIETNSTYQNSLGGRQATKFGLQRNNKGKLSAWRITNDLLDIDHEVVESINSPLYRPERKPRQQSISYLTAAEAQEHGVNNTLSNYRFSPNNSGCETRYQVTTMGAEKKALAFDELERDDSYRLGHHLSEINVLQPDGTLYNFGLPVYQTENHQVSFSVDGSNSGKDLDHYLSGTTQYTSGSNGDDGITNTKGIDNYFEEVTTPAYATAFLLTNILSQDYSDLTENGPTVDDLGSYVKFNYSMPDYDENNSNIQHHLFSWRSPFNDANWARGYESDELDDRGSFSYGKREQWLMHSIETKDRIAVFELGDRADGYGSLGRNGGINTNGHQQKHLVGIKIFDRREFEQNGLSAKPIREVRMHYSYDLCNGISTYASPSVSTNCNTHPLKDHDVSYASAPKYSGGKLTLNKVEFIDSELNMVSHDPYVFEYKTENPDYAYRSSDRWGTYHPLDLHQAAGVSDDRQTTLAQYSYSHQEKPDIDSWASAWMLSDITLPSGGKIQLEYESDDYAFVQNKQAMVMHNIKGIRKTLLGADGDELYDGVNDANLYVTFEKESGTTASDYVPQNDLIFFSFNVNLAKRNETASYEQVSGFFTIEEYGDISSNLAYIKVNPYGLGKRVTKKVHPVSKMGWQYALSNVPHVMNPKGYTKRSSAKEKVEDAVNQVVGIVPEYVKTIMGATAYYQARNHANTIDIAKSFIRLHKYDRLKFGGGHRVKRVTSYDNWEDMTGQAEPEATYSTRYEYATVDPIDSANISSGVAIYEPFVGGEENPLVMPINYEALKDAYIRKRTGLLSPITIGYDLGPVGEAFYPSPGVGYSKVIVRTEVPHANIIRHKTGRTEYEFFTAYNFPTQSSMTTIDKRIRQFSSPSADFKGETDTISRSRKSDEETEPSKSGTKNGKFKFGLDVGAKLGFAAVSQGFIIELNDMHGKSKSVKTYKGDNPDPVSATTYHYKMDGKGALVNTVEVLRNDGTFAAVEMGVQMDPTVYGFRSVEVNQDGAIAPNVNIGNPMPIPIIPSLLGSYRYYSNDSRLMIMTKQVYRNGILDSISVVDKGAHTYTKNVAWDPVTGKVLLTKTKDEFDDAVYTLKKPAYWMNQSLAGAYQNIGLMVQLSSSGSTLTDPTGQLHVGDVLVRTDITDATKYWVLDITAGALTIVDIDGNDVAPTMPLKVLRSGHRNLLNFGAETTVLKNNPLDYNANRWDDTDSWDNVISAAVVDYNDRRQMMHKLKYCTAHRCDGLTAPQISGDLTTYGYGYRNTPAQYFQDFNFEYDTLNFGPGNGIFYGKPADCDCGINALPQIPDCELCPNQSGFEVTQSINPFLYGLKGIWRPSSEMTYYEKRNSSATRVQTETVTGNPNSTYIREAGYLPNFQPYWSYQSSSSSWTRDNVQSNTNPWTWKDSITKTDFFGNDLESVSALNGIKNSVLYDFNRQVPVAIASNAAYHEVLFESFEDYSADAYVELKCQDYTAISTDIQDAWTEDFCDAYRHWKVGEALIGGVNRISEQHAHTGHRALMLGDGWTEINLSNDAIAEGGSSPGGGPINLLDEDDFVHNFFLKPTTQKQYVMSFWVKEGFEGQFGLEMIKENGGIESTLSLVQETADVFVNEWRKISYRFTLNAGEQIHEMRMLVNRQSGEPPMPCYVDDIMIFPSDAVLNAYVYDRDKKRLMAGLGPNNFATFYEYDEEGNLERQKVETDRGIMTLGESRQSFKH